MTCLSISMSTTIEVKSAAAKSEITMRRMPTNKMNFVNRIEDLYLCRKLPIQFDDIHEVDYRQL